MDKSQSTMNEIRKAAVTQLKLQLRQQQHQQLQNSSDVSRMTALNNKNQLDNKGFNSVRLPQSNEVANGHGGTDSLFDCSMGENVSI